MRSLWTGPIEDPRRYRVDIEGDELVALGTGGEGLVYMAVPGGAPNEVVALKLHTTVAATEFDVFRSRVQVIQSVHHTGIMDILDVFIGTALTEREDLDEVDFDVMYTVARWIPGASLTEAHATSSMREGLTWVSEVAHAVAYLHAFRAPGAPYGIVHRDVKPSNVRITPDGHAVLIDFGIARPFIDGDLTQGLGTHLWRPPEVLGAPGSPGPASDTWAVGALAYWVVSGAPPHLEGSTAARDALLPAIKNEQLPDAKGFAELIAGALEIEPQRRPHDLDAWADELALRAAGRTPRNRTLLVGIATAAIICVGLIAAGVAGAIPSPLSGTPDRHLISENSTTTTTVARTLATATTSTSVPSTTSSTTNQVRTTPSLAVPAVPQTAVPTTTTTTTTTTYTLPTCLWTNFSTSVSTDHTSYAQGQTVAIVLTFKNDGWPCDVNATGYGCPQVIAYNALGEAIWSSNANSFTGCPTQTEAPTEVYEGWSQSYNFSWNQTSSCPITSGPSCSPEQVPAGQYQVIGADNHGESQIPPSAPETITIAPAS